MTVVTWPSNLTATLCDFRLQKNTARFVSPIARTVQSMDRQGKRWTASYTFQGDRAVGQLIYALLDKGDEFLMWDMRRPAPLGPNLDRSSLPITYFSDNTRFVDAGSPLVRTGFSGGAAGVTVRGGWAVGSTAPLLQGFVGGSTPMLAGDYLGIGDYLYMLTDDLVMDGFGRGYAALNRGLLAAVSHGTVVTRTRPRAKMLLQDDDQNQGPMPGNTQVYEFNLSFFEKLPA